MDQDDFPSPPKRSKIQEYSETLKEEDRVEEASGLLPAATLREAIEDAMKLYELTRKRPQILDQV